MSRVATDAEQASMDLGMQSLDSPIQNLGGTRVFSHVLNGQAGVTDGLGRPAGGEELDALSD